MLTEAEIQRYSRQILLRDVGGRGQARLLGAPIRVHGRGAALETAVAYLVAGGSPVTLLTPMRGAGFLGGLELSGPVAPDLSSDAGPSARGGVAFATLSTELGALSSTEASVFLGPAGLSLRSAAGCPGCMARTALALASGPPSTAVVMLGALASLAVQRLVLGLSPALDALGWNGEAWGPIAVLPCAEHLQGGGGGATGQGIPAAREVAR